MNMKSKTMAAMAMIVTAAAFAAAPAGAIGRITNVYTVNPSGPAPAKGYHGSYYKSQTLWGDGIEHINEVGTTINTVYDIYGTDYASCHNALLAAMNANGYNGWTDCTPL